MPSFGPTKTSGSSEMEQLLKSVGAATVKFSNDKLLKALYLKGERATQEDFSKLFSALEAVKIDRSSIPFSQHMEAIWATVSAFTINILPKETPAKEHLATCQDSAQYYLNRILKLAKESEDEKNIEWVNSMNLLLAGLVTSGTGSTKAAPVKEERQPLVAAKEEAFVVVKAEDEAVVIDQEPSDILVLEGNRWYIRKAKDLSEPLVVKPEAINQAVAIEDSKNIAIKVDGKINALLADKCSQVALEVGDVVSSIELLGCTKIRLFLNGEAHVVVLDGCEAVQIYISASSRNAKIITSKCAEINILAPAGLLDTSLSGDEAEDYVEMAVPEQFFTKIDSTGKLVTEPHEHVGV